MAATLISSEDIRRLSSGRWLIPILALVSRDGGSRFGVLARQLGISRSVLTTSLDLVERHGWMSRNPGHGHPLRPEYLLTVEGVRLGSWCETVMRQRESLGLDQSAFGRWSLPLLLEVKEEQQPFGVLLRGLSPISPRALSMALTQMRSIDFIRHEAPLYALTALGHRFTAPLLQL